MLDTNICIDVIRKHSKHLVSKIVSQPVGTVGISSIVMAELQYGVAKSSDPEKNLKALLKFCAPLEILPFDDNAALSYGTVRTGLESKGIPIGPLDTLIAAHALTAGVVLVTNNTREFRRIKDLHVENWTRR